MDADETTVLISSNSQQITDDITNYVGDERKKAVTNDKFKLPMCNVHTSLTFIKAICAIICIVTLCGVSITLPILSQSILLSGYCHSNQYYTLISCDIWFPVAFWLAALMVKLYNPSFSFKSYTSHRVFALLGLLEALNAVFVVYASPPNRTTPSLQVILRSLRIPYTVVLSYIVLHKSSGAGRLICTLGTLIGLFISFEPNIFNIDNQYDHHAGESLVWPIIFGLAYLPNSLSTVLQEREIKKDSMEEALIFEAWLQTYKVFYFGLVFWVEFIPGFGESKTLQQFRNGMFCGLMSQFTGNSKVHYPWAAGISCAFILFFCISQLSSLLLLRYADGANYLVIIQALVIPLVAFFWTMFTDKKYFHWYPHFTISTGFIIAGVTIILPCVLLYSHFSAMEEGMLADDNDNNSQN